MGPSRALRLVARDRARRNPGSRPAQAAIHQGNAWWDAKLVSILGTGSAAAEAKGAAPNREAGLGVLRSDLDEMRAAQAAEQSWREPVAELTAAAAKARGEIVRLRASLDELSKGRQPEVVAIQARIDRMEQAMLQHHLLGAI